MAYYDNEDSFNPHLGMFAAGGAALTGVMVTGRFLKNRQNDIFQKMDSYDWAKKSTSYQKLRAESRLAGRPKNSRFFNNLYTGAKENISMYMPGRSRVANAFEKAAHKQLWNRNVSRVIKSSGAATFGLWTINDAIKEHGIKGIGIGVAREVGAQVGATVGMAVGAPLFYRGMGGLAGAASIGKFTGMALGATAGFMAVDALMKMSKLGRKWSMPELGGLSRVADSEYAMTMRQRSINMISTSQFNIRNELGREALHLSGM